MLNEDIKWACKLNDLILYWAWGCSFVVEHVLSMGKSLSLILTMEERKEERLIGEMHTYIFIIILLMY